MGEDKACSKKTRRLGRIQVSTELRPSIPLFSRYLRYIYETPGVSIK